MSRIRSRLSRRREGPRIDPEVLVGDMRERMADLESAVRDLAEGDGAPPGFDPGLFLAPGIPRVRPVLVLLSERAARDPSVEEGAFDAEDAHSATVHVAVAAEMLHLAVMVHDAALGQQGGRRRRAARRLLGGAVGWLGGNHLALRALELARHAPAPETVGDLLAAMREIAEGHVLSEELRGMAATSEHCVSLAEGHTGAVFDFACRSGARLAGAERNVVHSLGRYGRHAGIAWHLAEDLATLDLNSDEAADVLGERARHGPPVFVVSLAAERDPQVAVDWAQLAETEDPDLAAELAARVTATGALGAGRERITRSAWAARKALGNLAPSPHKDALDHLAAALAK